MVTSHRLTSTRRHFGNARKLPSGRYQASYWHDGMRHTASGTFATKADAQLWLARAESDLSRGSWIAPGAGKVTVAEVAQRWLGSNPLKRSSTVQRDRAIIDAHVLAALGSRRIDQVTKAEVQSVVDGWATTLAASTVGRMASVLRAIFRYAVDSELVARSPVSGLRLPRVGLVERPTLTADDLGCLADALGPQAPMMWLGVLGGLRWAECAGLTVGNLDLLSGTVTVRQQLGRDLKLGPPKSVAGRRRLALPEWLVEDLAAQLARLGLTAADRDALVFCAPKGEPLRYQNWLRRTWRPACQASSFPTLRFHDLRSMAATALVSAGVDVRTAQTRMGHSSPSVTLAIYARATAEADRRAADAVGRALGSARARGAHAVNNPRPNSADDQHLSDSAR